MNSEPLGRAIRHAFSQVLRARRALKLPKEHRKAVVYNPHLSFDEILSITTYLHNNCLMDCVDQHDLKKYFQSFVAPLRVSKTVRKPATSQLSLFP